jgi:molybdopterin-guanine dinucleotide biosynthesis protein A
MFSALVPAAGMSTRLGRNKLLFPFNGRPMIARAVDTLLASKLDKIIVVPFLTIEMETDHVVRDMDTIEDYERMVAAWSSARQRSFSTRH